MRFDADSTLSASAMVALASFLTSLMSSFEEMTDSAMLLRPPILPSACPALCRVARLWICPRSSASRRLSPVTAGSLSASMTLCSVFRILSFSGGSSSMVPPA